jgi:hypothetical protein
MVFGKKEIVDDATKSKIVTKSQSEGSGIYSCTSGACATNPFTTSDKKEWEEHRGDKKHYRLGFAPCSTCHQEVDMNVVTTWDGHEPQHPECKQGPEEL